MADRNSTHSTLRERIVEHGFVGDALRRLWKQGILNVEVLRPEFDAHGYDLVMSRGRIVRHIQLKTGTSPKPAVDVSVPLALAEKPSGCVLWIHVDDALKLGPYFWFGGEPGQPLPILDKFKVPRRATHNKKGERPERINHRLIPRAQFVKLDSLSSVLEHLFGDLR